MEESLYTRFSMAGWLFISVLLASLWHSDSRYWAQLLAEIRAIGLSGDSTLTAAFIGAAVGIGGPPAVGFLIERALSVVLSLATSVKSRVRGHPSGAIRTALLNAVGNERVDQYRDLDESALSAMFFLSEGNELLAKEREWRKMQFFVSLTSAIGVGLALAIAELVLDSTTITVSIVAGIFLVILSIHGIHNGMRNRRLMQTWTEVYGLKLVTRYAETLQGRETPGSPGVQGEVRSAVPVVAPQD